MTTTVKTTIPENINLTGKLRMPLLREEMKYYANEIIEQKNILRQPHDDKSPSMQAYLSTLRKKYTLLCAIRAHHRGRVHRIVLHRGSKTREKEILTLEDQFNLVIGDEWTFFMKDEIVWKKAG